MVAKATAHPDRRLISSEDVQGTEVYGPGDKAIGEIDHLLIEKDAVTSLHRSGAEAAKTIGPMIGSSLKRIKRGAAGLTSR